MISSKDDKINELSQKTARIEITFEKLTKFLEDKLETSLEHISTKSLQKLDGKLND